MRETNHQHLSKVASNNMTKLPIALIRQLGIEPGDYLQYTVDPESKTALVKIVQVNIQPKGD